MSYEQQSGRPDVSGEGNLSHYGDLQNEIYSAGLRGIVPSFPVAADVLAERAAAAMPPQVLSYVQGACGDEFTQRRNVEAFHHWGLIPRMMVDCTHRDMSIELFGLKLPSSLSDLTFGPLISLPFFKFVRNTIPNDINILPGTKRSSPTNC